MMLSLRRWCVLCVALLLLVGCGLPGRCGTLDDFEKDATKNTDQQAPDDHSDKPHDDDHGDHPYHHDHDHDHDNNDNGPSVRVAGEIFGEIAKASWYRVASPAKCREMGMTMRHIGDPTLPILRMEADYRYVSTDVRAIDLRFECGFGPLGVQYNTTNYQEQYPTDSLTISQIYGLFRISPSPAWEVDLGFGSMILDGNKRTVKDSFTLPILYHPRNSHVGFEIRPAWASRLQDYDAAALFTTGSFSLKAGYRAVLSPHDSLSGPYVGAAFRL